MWHILLALNFQHISKNLVFCHVFEPCKKSSVLLTKILQMIYKVGLSEYSSVTEFQLLYKSDAMFLWFSSFFVVETNWYLHFVKNLYNTMYENRVKQIQWYTMFNVNDTRHEENHLSVVWLNQLFPEILALCFKSVGLIQEILSVVHYCSNMA